MNQYLARLVDRIRNRFPLLDVRTDQCDTVRVIAKGAIIGIEERGGEFIAQFMSLDADLETKLIKKISSYQFGDFELRVVQNLATLIPHGKLERP